MSTGEHADATAKAASDGPIGRSVSVSFTATPVDDVIVAPSTTLKYLRLRNGDYACHSSVFLVIAGQRHEITMDGLPEDVR